MKKRSFLVSIILVSLISLSTISAKGHKSHQMGMMSNHQGGSIISLFLDLNLTDEQSVSIKQIILDRNYQKQTEMLSSSTNPKEAILKSAITTTGFDKTVFIEAATVDFATKIEDEANFMESIFNVLTDTQKEVLYNNLNN